jgi:hypothetical protein
MISVASGDLEKVFAQRKRRTRASASEKVGVDFEYQKVCRRLNILFTNSL